MKTPIRLTAAACAALLALAPARAADFPEFDRYVTVKEQRAAILACKTDLGRDGWPKFRATYVEYPAGGQTRLEILPHRAVSARDADWINACAAESLGLDRAPAGAKPNQAACPPGAPVIVGGARYCTGG